MLPHFAPLESVALLVRLVQDVEVPIPVDDRLRRIKREVRIAAVNRRIGQDALPTGDQQVARNAAMHVRQRHIPAVGILAQVFQPGGQFDLDLAFVDDADHCADRGREDVWKLRASHIGAVHGESAISHRAEPARLGQAQDAAALDRRLAVVGIPAQNPLVKPLGGVGWMARFDWHLVHSRNRPGSCVRLQTKHQIRQRPNRSVEPVRGTLAHEPVRPHQRHLVFKLRHRPDVRHPALLV